MLLTVLKIVGIILLVILCPVLLLILTVLFVPVRYRLEAEAAAGAYKGKGKMTWLLHSFSVKVDLDSQAEKKATLKIRILGLDFLSLMSKMKEKRKTKGDRAKPKKEKQNKKLAELEKHDPQTYEELRAEALAKRKAEKEKIEVEETAAKAREDERLASLKKLRGHRLTKRKQKREILAERLARLIRKAIRSIAAIGVTLYELPGVVIHAVGKAFGKIRQSLRTIKRWRYFLQNERTAEALKLVLKSLKKLIRHIRPKTIKGHLTYGFDDPYQTGLMLAAADSVYGLWSRHFTLTPDFEKKALDGHVLIKGKIRGIVLAVMFLELIFDKDIKYVVRFMNRKKEKNHG